MIKDVGKTINDEAKEQTGGFLEILLGTSLLGNLLTGKDTIRAGECTNRASENF